MKSALALLTAVLLLAGCTGHRPAARPAQPVPPPPTWTAASELSQVESPTPRIDLGFADPELTRVVQEALAANSDLRAAAARVERAAAQARIAGADLSPHLAATVDGARRRQNFIGLPIPGAEGAVLTNTSTTLGLGLNVSWEVDLWGRLRAQSDAANADLEAARLDYELARLSLVAQTTKVWLALREAHEQARLAEATRDNLTRSADRIARRYEAGLAGAVELRLARTNTHFATATVARRAHQLDSTRRQLEVLLGRYPAGVIEGERGVHHDTALPRLERPIPPGLPAELVARRPDLRAAERRLAAADARVAAARAARYPQIRLTSSGGTSSTELRDLLDGDFSVWSFAAGLLQPLFQGGRLQANVDLSTAIADELAATFVTRVLLAFAEVETALDAEQALERQELALRAAADAARAALGSAEQRYLTGAGDYLLVLTSQRDTFDAESRLLEVQRQRLTSRVDLLLALGGDFAPISDSPISPTAPRPGA